MFERQTELLKESEALNKCSFYNWYEKFQKISIKSKCLRIPENIVEYLLDEIIILPKECNLPNNSDVNYEYDNDNIEESEEPEFIEFSNEITSIIDELGGSIYLKTNWHSPKDAFWITAGQTMRVKDITDVYQLLKASGICKDDLTNQNLPLHVPEQSSPENYLILKKWQDIHPGTEFRCFVRDHRLIAISPRDWPQFHEHIVQQKSDIINDIRTTFREQIKHKFPLNDYIFDVVRDGKDHVVLLDFSPFGEKWTESLAFEWTEFDEFFIDDADDDCDEPEFRYLTSECGIQPTKRNNYGMPKDIIDMFQQSSNEGCSSLDEFLADRLRGQCLRNDSD